MGKTSCRDGLRASDRARCIPYQIAINASGHATVRGIPDAIAENAASAPSAHIAPTTQYDGRHSSRQGADVIDQGLEFGIVGGIVTKEPAPEPIVFAIQQP